MTATVHPFDQIRALRLSDDTRALVDDAKRRPTRAERRAAARRRHPSGRHLEPVTVSREMPLTVLRHADGTTDVIDHDTAEPCYECRCCAVWARNLEQLAAAIRAHALDAHDDAGAPVDSTTGALSCLVCQLLAGDLDEPAAADE